jgi:hypothetical protein
MWIDNARRIQGLTATGRATVERLRMNWIQYLVVTNFPPPRSEGIVVWHVSSYPGTS